MDMENTDTTPHVTFDKGAAALSGVGDPVVPGGPDVPPPAPAQRWTMRRSRSDRMLGGVCGGAARALDVDATLLRLGLVVLTVLGAGAGIVIYLAAWILVPLEDERYS